MRCSRDSGIVVFARPGFQNSENPVLLDLFFVTHISIKPVFLSYAFMRFAIGIVTFSSYPLCHIRYFSKHHQFIHNHSMVSISFNPVISIFILEQLNRAGLLVYRFFSR